MLFHNRMLTKYTLCAMCVPQNALDQEMLGPDEFGDEEAEDVTADLGEAEEADEEAPAAEPTQAHTQSPLKENKVPSATSSPVKAPAQPASAEGTCRCVWGVCVGGHVRPTVILCSCACGTCILSFVRSSVADTLHPLSTWQRQRAPARRRRRGGPPSSRLRRRRGSAPSASVCVCMCVCVRVRVNVRVCVHV
jgi:hypothetical protein